MGGNLAAPRGRLSNQVRRSKAFFPSTAGAGKLVSDLTHEGRIQQRRSSPVLPKHARRSGGPQTTSPLCAPMYLYVREACQCCPLQNHPAILAEDGTNCAEGEVQSMSADGTSATYWHYHQGPVPGLS
jgi:hypothetical protein